MGALFEMMPWARAGPGWPTIAMLCAMTGAGLTLVLQAHLALKRLAATTVWLGLLGVLVLALRGQFPGTVAPIGGDRTSLIIAIGVALAGVFAWLLGGAAAISEDRRQRIAPLVFVLVAAAIGALTASDLLILIVWQFAIGGSVIGFVLLLREPAEPEPARALMTIEAIILFGAGVALAVLGTEVPKDAQVSVIGAIGLATLLFVLVARLIGLIVALPLVARAQDPVLAAEVAVAAIAVPAILHTLIVLIEQFRTVLPPALVIVLTVSAIILLLVGAGLAIGARTRGARIAAIAASLIGLASLGACEGSKTSLLFVLLWLGPVPAFLAASSIAGRVNRGGASIVERALTPEADAIGLLLVMASLALIGLPPFAGFWARLILIEAAWARADYAIVALTLLSSLILAFALARRSFERVPAIVGVERRNRAPGIALPELLVLGVMSGLSLAGGVYPAPFISMADATPGASHTAFAEAR